MKIKDIREFFIPGWKKLLVFVVFIGIAVAGNIQSWALGADEMGVPKPFLYDYLDPFPFWPLWIMLTLPLQIVISIFNTDYFNRLILWTDDLHVTSIIFWSLQVLYFYLLSCFVIFIGSRLMRASQSSGREFGKGFFLSFLFAVLSFLLTTLLSLFFAPLFSFEQGSLWVLSFYIVSSAPFWFLVANSIALVVVGNPRMRRGISWGYLCIFLFFIFWIIMAFLAVGFHG